MTNTTKLSSKTSSVPEHIPSAYVGRFAPSPTGPLHFGSLFCALGSYLHAKQNNGKWLVRIEDIDTPRVDESTIKTILDCLQAHGLQWDDDVVFQSQRHALYDSYLDSLNKQELLYACACTRSQIRSRGLSYDGHCRLLGLPFSANAIRFIQTNDNTHFHDGMWGMTHINHAMATEDPVLKRADGIFSYHLSVVVDDIEQGVNHIVRGNDLLDTTPVHLSLYQALHKPSPRYMHLPIIVQKAHEKLSKQHYSPAVDNGNAINNIKLALIYLGLPETHLPKTGSIEQLLYWAINNWHPKLVVKQTELLISVTNDVYSKARDIRAVNVDVTNYEKQ